MGAALRRILSRTVQALVLLTALSAVLFRLMTALPGDPVDLLVAANPEVSPQDIARLKRLRGLDQPWHVQYARWLWGYHEARMPPRYTGPTYVPVESAEQVWRVSLAGHLHGDGVSVLHAHGCSVVEGGTVITGAGPQVCVVVLQDAAGLQSALTLRAGNVPVPSVPTLAVLQPGDPVVLPPGAKAVSNAETPTRFDQPGQHVLVLDVSGVPHAFTVDHGLVPDPARPMPGFLQGELGFSNTYKRPVSEILRGRLIATLSLALPAFLLSLLLAVVLGTWCATRAGSAWDRALSTLAFGAMSVPVFWLGLLLVTVFSVTLGWFPPGGMLTPGQDDVADRFAHAVLPTLVLAAAYTGRWLRFVRGAVLDALTSPFILAARARGFQHRAVVWRFALRAALIPLITTITLALPGMAAGAVLTESVFSWPGMGRLILESVTSADHYVAMVAFLMVAALVQLSALLADALYLWADPRTRSAG